MPDRKSKKPKLLVIMGAGSSLPCGMPGVGEIDARMKEWSGGWSDPPPFPPGAIGEGIFNQLWRGYDRYLNRKPQKQYGLSVNFERVLGEMTALASWVTPPLFGNPLIECVQDGRISDEITWPAGIEGDFGQRHLVVQQHAYLLGQLAKYMRGKSLALNQQSPTFQTYKRILEALRNDFELGIYTLNYDNVAVRAWPDAFTGFEEEVFSPASIANREEWSFIYHLHGSVHYSLAEPGLTHAVKWKADLAADDFEDTRHLNTNMAGGFVPIIPTTLIAGGYKLDQLLANPSQMLFASFVRHLQQADAVITIGYGFGDGHVNRALQNRMELSPRYPNTRPRTAVMTFTLPNGGLIGDRQGHEFFSVEMTHSLFSRFPGAGSVPPTPSLRELKDSCRLEHDRIGRVAVWHNGFLESEPHLEQITRWLRNH